jgi:hypothetical protein
VGQSGERDAGDLRSITVRGRETRAQPSADVRLKHDLLHGDVAAVIEFAGFEEGGEGFEDFFDAAGAFCLGGQKGFVDIFGGRAGGKSD